MTVFQELLIFFGAPILVVVAVFAAVYLRHPRPQSRYRPGEPYNFKPVWFVAREGAVGAEPERPAAVESGRQAAELGGSNAGGHKGGSHGKW